MRDKHFFRKYSKNVALSIITLRLNKEIFVRCGLSGKTGLLKSNNFTDHCFSPKHVHQFFTILLDCLEIPLKHKKRGNS